MARFDLTLRISEKVDRDERNCDAIPQDRAVFPRDRSVAIDGSHNDRRRVDARNERMAAPRDHLCQQFSVVTEDIICDSW